MRFRLVTGVMALALMTPALALAGTVRFSTPNCGGFSSCDDSSFVAGAGVPLIFNDLSIATRSNPEPVLGSLYSSDFTLSSSASATFGGSDSTFVEQGNSDSASSEAGPVGSGFSGILNVNFATPQTAVGFGTVQLGDDPLEVIRLYNGNTLLGTFDPISSAVFNYEGFVATGGDVITSAQLEGNFFAIQNIKYSSAAPVPEPATLLLLGSGLAMSVRRRLKKRA